MFDFTSSFVKNLTRLAILLFAGFLFVSEQAVAEQDIAKHRPNVVFILADDLGWRDLSVEGSTFYESPRIDSIAQAGMRFTRGYAACQVCSPSRASILTGKFPARHGITDWIGAAAGPDWKRNTKLLPAEYLRALPADDITLAERLKEAGYRTFFAGKWHLGGAGSLPTDHGFDINIGGHHAGSPPGGYFSPYKNPEMKDGPPGESLPMRLGEETASFIREHVQAHPDQPFLAYLSFYSVHGPLQTSQKLWSKYREKAALHQPTDHRFLIDRTSPVRQVQDNPIYAGMIQRMDDAVGLVLTALEVTGQKENTIVIFTSDNGGVSAGDGKATSNLPLRGGKGRQWEGGLREPFYISYPPGIPSGSTCDVPVIHTDFYPTILDLAGLDLMPQQHVDGTSLVPLFHQEKIADRALYWHYPHYGNQGGEPSAIVLRDNWKLIHYYEDGRDELYQISQDVGEQQDLAADESDRVKTIRAELQTWLKATGANMPVPNPDYDEAANQREIIHTREKTLPQLEAEAASFLEPNFTPNKDWWGSRD
jgi:arylsulfatase A-like enzyme